MMCSMLRTQNRLCVTECTLLNQPFLQGAAVEEVAPFFVACVRAAMRAGLDAAIEAGIDVIALARISGGIYAGNWRPEMTQDFYRKLVEDLLAEEVLVRVETSVDDTASGQDAAPDPHRDTGSGQDAAPDPHQDTASGQDAPPNPDRDTASGQNDPR